MHGSPLRAPSIVIVGAGFSGICFAAKLLRRGIMDFVILEKAQDVGGTWRENTYPGLRCDVPTYNYQFSFHKNPDWSGVFAPQPEILQYLRTAAVELKVQPHIRFGEHVCDARFVDTKWQITTTAGTVYRCDFMITATGVLHHPRVPQFSGADSFRGSIFHSARWDHDVRLDDKRVVIVGSGSTGVQIVSALARANVDVTLLQRTPQWVVPVPEIPRTVLERWLFRKWRWPGKVAYACVEHALWTVITAQIRDGWQRRLVNYAARWNLNRVRDPNLRQILTPADLPMCKRLVAHQSFYQDVQRKNVQVVSAGIDHIDSEGIATDTGQHIAADVIILATGFDPHAYVRPIAVTNEAGQPLDSVWSPDPRAYRTVAIDGFPNFFMMLGPHSPIGNFSLVAVAEDQADYALRWIDRWRTREFDTVSPTSKATIAYNDRLAAAAEGTIWVSGCSSWYLRTDGTPELWPLHAREHRRMLSQIDSAEFDLNRFAESRDTPILPTTSITEETTP
ncbi:flavin-containing monooxygenase [Mycobacteroides chelonae]|uniref:flavin-containing monooxygenase n=1 Tax=Mycobacteroides chelonae TaxID=1774 RepID=UPI0008A9C374|nr:NAD(P)/FAD-dependent oxidoreductase [Mycobacteroides chelonae]OHU62286.1 monooxygenase [Mycobacteroides chelonae]